MHCTSCNKLLTDYESTRKNAVTGKYFDLCKVCFEDIKPFVKVLDRKDLISEADLDDEDLEDVDLDTQASLEDYEDLISDYRDNLDEL
jgi:hypothetical protein